MSNAMPLLSGVLEDITPEGEAVITRLEPDDASRNRFWTIATVARGLAACSLPGAILLSLASMPLYLTIPLGILGTVIGFFMLGSQNTARKSAEDQDRLHGELVTSTQTIPVEYHPERFERGWLRDSQWYREHSMLLLTELSVIPRTDTEAIEEAWDRHRADVRQQIRMVNTHDDLPTEGF